MELTPLKKVKLFNDLLAPNWRAAKQQIYHWGWGKMALRKGIPKYSKWNPSQIFGPVKYHCLSQTFGSGTNLNHLNTVWHKC